MGHFFFALVFAVAVLFVLATVVMVLRLGEGVFERGFVDEDADRDLAVAVGFFCFPGVTVLAFGVRVVFGSLDAVTALVAAGVVAFGLDGLVLALGLTRPSTYFTTSSNV